MTFRDIGLRVVRGLPQVEKVARFVYARLPSQFHDTPTSRAKAFFAAEKDVHFVEIGAYDGVAGDPIRPLILANCAWRGVLVEPQPDIFVRLQQNYRDQASRLTLLNAAISDQAGEMDFHLIPPEERQRLSLPDWGGEVASFGAEHLRRHFPQAKIETRRVKVMTFADAAALLPGHRVDLVVMDVEGHERVILQSIDFDRHRVRFIVFEHKHMSAEEARGLQLALESHGFQLKWFGRDTIAWRSSAEKN